MTIRLRVWQCTVVLTTVALTIPLWMQSGRADPLFLLPLLGWTSLAVVGGNQTEEGWPKRLAQVILKVAVALCALVWAVSDQFALMQIAIVSLFAFPLAFLHQWIAAGRRRWRKLVLHLMLVIVWLPLGMMVTSAAYRWPALVDRPRVMLFSSIPLVWGSGSGDMSAILAGDNAPVPFTELLLDTSDVRAVDSVTAEGLRAADVLLLVQPRALSLDARLAIDSWLREGGRVLWFADPRLMTGQDFPLGDQRNAEVREPNIDLLARWGLRLQDSAHAALGPHVVIADAVPLRLDVAGQLAARNQECRSSAGGMIARCQIGQGQLVVVADADMVATDNWTNAEAANAHHPVQWTAANGQWVVAALRSLAELPENRSLAKPVWLRPALLGRLSTSAH